MAAFKPGSATLEECYEQIRELGKANPSVVKRVQDLEDFSSFSKDYIELVCRTPNTVMPRASDMKTDECEVLILQNHIPFPEKWKNGHQLNYMHKNQFESMMPSDVNFNILNLVKFPPSLFNHPTNRSVQNKFTSTQMKNWLPYMLHEIDVAKPKVLVATSTEIVKLLGLKMSNTNNRGEVHISPVVGLPVIITLHVKVLNMIRQTATGGMWGDDYYSVIRNDLWKASHLVNGRVQLRDLDEALADVNVTVCESIEDVKHWTDFLTALPPKQFTSWDLETNSLDPWFRGLNRFGEEDHARILTSQVGYRKADGTVHAIVFPLWHRDNHGYDPDEAFEIHKKYLLRDSCKVGHHVSFDICFLAGAHGVRLRGTILDTMLAIHSLDSGIKGCFGLKAAVWDYLLPSGLGGYEDVLKIDDEREGWIPIVEEEG